MIVEIDLNAAAITRMERIRQLRNGRPLSDQDLILNAINCYWLALESRKANDSLAIGTSSYDSGYPSKDETQELPQRIPGEKLQVIRTEAYRKGIRFE